MYAKTEAEYDNKKEEFLLDPTCLKYPQYIEHISTAYFNRKHTWAISVRNDEKLPTYSTNTSNYIEASFRITKDGQFNRTKAFNLVDLLHILLDNSIYYEKRLLDIGNGRMGAFRNTKSRYNLNRNNAIIEDHIIDVGEYKFIVRSEKDPEIFYQVDMVSGYCECKAGHNCGPCKHKGAISKFRKLAEFSILPESDAKIRALYHFIANGSVCTNSWYRDLDNPLEEIDVSKFIDERTHSNEVENVRTNTEISNQPETMAETDLIEVHSEEEGDSDEEEDDTEEVLNQFKEAMDAFKEKIMNVYESKLKKGVKCFTKKLRKFTKQKNSSL